MKRRYRKVLGCLTAALLLASLFSGCASSQDGGHASSARSSSSQAAPAAGSSSSLPSSSSAASSSYPVPENDPQYVKAFQCYANKQYDQAVSLSNDAIAKDPNCFWAYNIKGIAYYFANGNSVAAECLNLIDKSISIDPQYSYGYFNKALILKGLKRFDESLDCFNQVLTLKPGDTWSYFGISTIYADENQFDPCLEYLKKAIDTDPSVKDTAKTESHFIKYHDNARFQALVGS